MFEKIRCPRCSSNEWTTVDEIVDYSDDMYLKIQYLCFCDECGHDFSFTNTYMYVRSDWKKEGEE